MSFPRMSWHIGDYRKDTGHLNAAGHGGYFLLCMHYWSTGGLPDDDAQLARIACMTDKEWRQWRPTLQAFFQDGWRHKRIDRELAEAESKYERRASAGRSGGNARAKSLANGKQRPSNSMALLPENHSNAVAKSKQPITDNRESAYADRPKLKHCLPDEWELSLENRAFARSKKWPEERIDSESQRFKDHAKSTGRKLIDWDAGWRNWVTSSYQKPEPAQADAFWKGPIPGVV